MSNIHWADTHEAETRIWFQKLDINAVLGDVGRAVITAARYCSFNPVRDDWLETLVWDKKKSRLDTWLTTYFPCPRYTLHTCCWFAMAYLGCSRIYDPGCQADHMLVLEGDQGIVKSSALRALVPNSDWFTDRLSRLGDKDAAIETAGVLIIEDAELNAFLHAASHASKSYLTRRVERYRPVFGRHTIKRGRQCVFAGTINPPTSGYLKDPTGARRIWPVVCPRMIDLDGIERDRDQLWAEAVARYKAGAKWWLETPELEALAEAVQRARYKVDPWLEPITK